ncbi:4-hydroxybenzoate polyprenyltransferase [hydrothermal vent metagenome]|uniref:4-hydroxybenzoate polyprenyltransferase n=1 Tax=hydrothermal vent metagenome TaxID=652676 RepID=A0A3B1AIM5_9ZZZZ
MIIKSAVSALVSLYNSVMKKLVSKILTPGIKDRLKQYYYLARLDRPIGIYLLLWPMLWALFIASHGKPDLLVLFVFMSGVVLMRSAGCVINDFADRKIDPLIERTKLRPIASGKVSSREALWLFTGLSLVAFILVLLTNKFTVLLSIVGVLLAAIYPFMKRYTNLPQLVLGMAFAWSVPMAFAAQTGEVPRIAWLIYAVTVVWTVIYDTMYAMADREEDLKIGVKSTAILFGEADRVILFVLQVLMFFGLYLLGQKTGMAYPYYVGLAVAIGFAAYQQYLIRDREPAKCFAAFLNNSWLGAVIFIGVLLSTYYDKIFNNFS